MGSSASKFTSHEDLLNKFAGTSSIGVKENFWNEFCTVKVPLTKLVPAEVELAMKPYCENLGRPALKLFIPSLLFIGETKLHSLRRLAYAQYRC